jgi:hypothetical protein
MKKSDSNDSLIYGGGSVCDVNWISYDASDLDVAGYDYIGGVGLIFEHEPRVIGPIWTNNFGFSHAEGNLNHFSEITRQSIALIERKKIADATPHATAKSKTKTRGL